MSSTGVRSQVSESGVKYNMSVYHAIGVKIATTRYETMIAKHEATQEMYSPEITEKHRKIPEHVRPTNPYNIYTYLYIF